MALKYLFIFSLEVSAGIMQMLLELALYRRNVALEIPIETNGK